eukprot:scaffold288767_cov27-Tisochrysis_lutea.AAC.1
MSATARTVVKVARDAMANSSSQTSAIALDVEIGSPQLTVAVQPGCHLGVRADLGCIVIRNKLERQSGASEGTPLSSSAVFDCVSISVHNMQLYSLCRTSEVVSDHSSTSSLIEELSVDVRVVRGIGSAAGAAIAISASTSDVACTCSKPQYDMLVLTLANNFAHDKDGTNGPGLQTRATETPDGDAQKQNLAKFTFQLDLPLVAVSLYGRPQSPSPEVQLVLVTMIALRVLCERLNDESSALVVSLPSLQVTDAMNQGRRLASSIPSAVEGDCNFGEPVVHIQYLRDSRRSVDEVHIRFSHLYLEWNPMTIGAVLTFLRQPLFDEGFAKSGLSHWEASEALPDMGYESGGLADQRFSRNVHELRVLVRLEALSAKLNREELG